MAQLHVFFAFVFPVAVPLLASSHSLCHKPCTALPSAALFLHVRWQAQLDTNKLEVRQLFLKSLQQY